MGQKNNLVVESMKPAKSGPSRTVSNLWSSCINALYDLMIATILAVMNLIKQKETK